MKYCKLFLLFSILFFGMETSAQTNITELIQYDVDISKLKDSSKSERSFNEWLDGLFEAVKNSDVNLYTAEYNIEKMNFDFSKIDSSKRDSLFIQVYDYIIVVKRFDEYGVSHEYDSLCFVNKKFNYNDVVKISFIEKWETDKQGNIVKIIEAFAPVVLTEVWNVETPLFWIKPSDMPDNLSFEGDITCRVKIKDKNALDEYWYIDNILPPNKMRFIQPFIDKIEKGELKEYLLDTFLPNRKIDSISFSKPLELFISLEVIPDEWEPFIVFDASICELEAQRVVGIEFKEKWVLNSKGFVKHINEFALVFEVIFINLPGTVEQYIYVLFWIKPE